jgi:hypothetical protein
MRHSKVDLTMNVYTDPALLDVRGALDALPALPLDRDQAEGQVLQATGTEGTAARTVAPTVAPNRCNRRQTESIPGTRQGQKGEGEHRARRRNFNACQKKGAAVIS